MLQQALTSGCCVALQAVIHCEIVRQAARVVAMDRERLRSGDRACVRFRFLQRPEYLTPGAQPFDRRWWDALRLKTFSRFFTVFHLLSPSKEQRLDSALLRGSLGAPPAGALHVNAVARADGVGGSCRDALCVPRGPHQGHRHGGQLRLIATCSIPLLALCDCKIGACVTWSTCGTGTCSRHR